MDTNASLNDDLVRDEVKVDVTKQDLGAELSSIQVDVIVTEEASVKDLLTYEKF